MFCGNFARYLVGRPVVHCRGGRGWMERSMGAGTEESRDVGWEKALVSYFCMA